VWDCGVLPLEFKPGESRESSLGLTGQEVLMVEGVSSLTPRKQVTVKAKAQDGSVKQSTTRSPRVDTARRSFLLPSTAAFLQYVLRQMFE